MATISSPSTPPGQDRHAGRDDRPHRPPGRGAGRRHRAGRRRRSTRRARKCRAPRPTVERAALEFDRSQKLAADQFRLAAAPRAGDRRPRPHRRRPGRAPRRAVVGRRRRSDGAKANLDVLEAQKVEAERTRDELADRAGEGASATSRFTDDRSRPSTASSATGRRRSANMCSRARGCWRWCRSTAPMSTPISRRRSSRSIQPGPEGRRRRRCARRASRSRAWSSSVSPASGSQFSLLPPDNATGNFTKVVQRVAVRIALPADALQRARCGPASRSSPRSHTRDESLPKPTLLGALGLTPSRREASSRRARARRERGQAARRRPRSVARRRRRAAQSRSSRSSAGSPPSSSWCSACSWRSWTSRSSRPRCRRSRRASRPRPDEVTWVQTSYLIAEVIMIPLSGFLSRVFSTRVIFTISAARLHADELLLRARRARSTR